jgi:hypothetical protein
MHVTTNAVPQANLLEEWCLLLTACSDLLGYYLECALMIVVALYVGQQQRTIIHALCHFPHIGQNGRLHREERIGSSI